MTGHVITFKANGTAEAMHNDKFDLSFLGKQTIVRATEIKFFVDTQKWGICLPYSLSPNNYLSAPEGQGFDTYEGARKVEVEWMNRCRLAGVNPEGAAGDELLYHTRKEMKL